MKDLKGRKDNRIEAYDRVQDGKVIHVSTHYRSNMMPAKRRK